MEVMVLGFARRLRQASQAASTMASWLSKTRFESQFWRRYCQMFSTGLSSGAREGRKMSVMFFGTASRAVVCQPARSRSSTAWAPRRTTRETSSRWSCMARSSGRCGLRPETRSRPACPWQRRPDEHSASRQSFFESRDGLPILSRVASARADVGEAELLQDLADRALVVGDAEALSDKPLQVDA